MSPVVSATTKSAAQDKKPKTDNRRLDPEKLTSTASQIASWLKGEFPQAHLTVVAEDVCKLTREATAKAGAIARPAWPLRLLLLLLFAGVVFGLYQWVKQNDIRTVMKLADDMKFAGMYIVAAVVFLITLEMKWKRLRVLRAVHELQSVCHIIDMHQLAKDPSIERFREQRDDFGNALFYEKVDEYLHACTALLAIVSKLGQLYIDRFPDPVATKAVNDFEETCTGLSTKIWSKIIYLNQTKLGAKQLQQLQRSRS